MQKIRQRGKCGHWQAIVARRGHQFMSSTFVEKQAAKDWAVKIEAKMLAGKYPELADKAGRAMTLAAAVDKYESEVSVHKRGYPQEKYRLNLWRQVPFAGRALINVQPRDLEAWIDARRHADADEKRKPVTDGTIRLDLALLSHLYTLAQRRWHLPCQNPVKSIELPKHNPARNRTFEPGEKRKLLAACRPNMRAVVQLAAETAMRRGDLAGLDWQWVKFSRRVIELPTSKTGPREVPLSPQAIRILKRLRPQPAGNVFGLRPSSITHALTEAREKAGIENFRFHDLKHVATTAGAERLPPHKLKVLSGHKGWQMLARYLNPRAEDVARDLAGPGRCPTCGQRWPKARR